MAKQLPLKDRYLETRIFSSRVILAFIVVFLLTSVLLARFTYLQVYRHSRYTTLADQNRVSVQPLAPTRGLIYDRDGTLVANNQSSHFVSVVKERTEGLDQTLSRLQSILDLESDQITDFKERVANRQRPFEAVPLKFDLSQKAIARIAVNRHRLPGVKVEAQLVRHYPFGSMLSHAIGYVGRINPSELQRVNASNYAATHHIGKVGVEHNYETELHGLAGFEKVETNARGRILRVLERTDPVPGQDLRLYLAVSIQRAAMRALGDRRGAVVALDPRTGGVLALASAPGYNPNHFVTGISHKRYSALRDSKDRPLFNRSIRGQYPPGSAVKPFLALGGVYHEHTNWRRSIEDPGWFRLEGKEHKYRDWKDTGHGTVDLHKAIVRSCDTYFYDLANRMGIDKMHSFMSRFGFGQATGIDLSGELDGVMPSRGWKRRQIGEVWFPGETIITGIGQGYMLSTPLQLARATATLANRGRPVVPKMVAVRGEGAATPQAPPQGRPNAAKVVTLGERKHWQKTIAAMKDVVHGPRGTARGIAEGLTYTVAGKTATSQVTSIPEGEEYNEDEIAERLRDHALFIAFAPLEQPEIALAVVVENGGSGGATAAPVARRVLDAYFANKDQG